MSRAIIGPIIALAYVGSLNFTISSVLRLVDHGVCGWVGGCVGGGGGVEEGRYERNANEKLELNS